jgi:hypothetical protein
MRWPYKTRIDAVHAWGVVAAGIAISGIIVGAVAATHANDSNFHWWWPTNWLSAPAGLTLIGLIMVVVPLRRKGDENGHATGKPAEASSVPQSFVQNIIAKSPGSKAQGAAFGNVINYGSQSDDGPPGTETPEKQGEQP